ncbi:MAG: peptidyl-prolyl cis-trans isomerase [Anaeromyxobacteraceae bacterium]
MRRARLLAAVAVAATLGGCRCGEPPATGQGAPRPVAVVNGEPIAAEALARELAHARAGEGDGAPGAPGAMKRRVLDEAVDRALLLQAARARAIAPPDERVQRALLAVRAEYPGSHFDDLLAQERLSQPELVARLRDQLTIEKLFADEVFPRVQVTDAELEQYYAEHAAEFEQPEQVHAFQIVVRTKEEAQRAREEARRRPQAFGEVARKASIAPEGRLGGDLGWFGKGSGMPEVFDACFKLPLNALSEVTPSPYGFHVFKVVARRGAARRPFAEARPVIEERLVREKRARAQDEYLAAARARARIEIDEKALEALAP